jgi:hypothetical protein
MYQPRLLYIIFISVICAREIEKGENEIPGIMLKIKFEAVSHEF